MYLPPPLGQKAFFRERGGCVYFEAPRGRIFIPPPLIIHPPQKGISGGVYKIWPRTFFFQCPAIAGFPQIFAGNFRKALRVGCAKLWAVLSQIFVRALESGNGCSFYTCLVQITRLNNAHFTLSLR